MNWTSSRQPVPLRKKARTRAEGLSNQASAIERKHEDQRLSPGRQWSIAGIRLGFIIAWFAASLRLVSVLRKRQSRFLALAFAAAATGVITAVVFATDYITDYIDPLDLGPIVLSVVGAVATVSAFVGLQRWLARRIPADACATASARTAGTRSAQC